MLLFKVADRVTGIVSVLILARLLVPADFGLVAMAMSVVALLELINGFSFDVALISRREITKEHYYTAWTLNIIAALLIALVMVAASPLAATFYREPRLVEILCVLAMAAIVQGFENVAIVDFRRNLQFRMEFIFLTAKRVATFSVVIPMAYILRSHWALVFGILSGRLIGVFLSYTMHPFRPRISLKAYPDLLGFSRWMLLNNLITFLKERLPEFVIGRISGPTSVGLYSMGSELAQLPTSEVVAPINRAILPNFASAVQDGHAMGAQYLRVVSVIALIIVPAGVGLSAIADLAVPLLLGIEWLEAVPVVEILALHGVLVAVQSIGFSVMLASHRPDIPAKLNTIHVVALLSFLILFTPLWGIVGSALAYLSVGALMAPINMAFVLRILHVPPKTAIAQIWRPITASIFMGLSVTAIFPTDLAHSSNSSRLLELALALLSGAMLYATLIYLLWRVSGSPLGGETELSSWISKRRQMKWCSEQPPSPR